MHTPPLDQAPRTARAARGQGGPQVLPGFLVGLLCMLRLALAGVQPRGQRPPASGRRRPDPPEVARPVVDEHVAPLHVALADGGPLREHGAALVYQDLQGELLEVLVKGRGRQLAVHHVRYVHAEGPGVQQHQQPADGQLRSDGGAGGVVDTDRRSRRRPLLGVLDPVVYAALQSQTQDESAEPQSRHHRWSPKADEGRARADAAGVARHCQYACGVARHLVAAAFAAEAPVGEVLAIVEEHGVSGLPDPRARPLQDLLGVLLRGGNLYLAACAEAPHEVVQGLAHDRKLSGGARSVVVDDLSLDAVKYGVVLRCHAVGHGVRRRSRTTAHVRGYVLARRHADRRPPPLV
mmetsp:Transcript_42409/g.131899  ORF Transcript_42409/g.131899 Transcript_42409/m.131899 type:complete len:350 (+) Transcript_42409:123-1172(+)